MTKKYSVTGIVVEYNPLHNGHIYHIKKAREITNCDVLIAVMSGNFVQRGEPAFINKWERTEGALNHGVDIVIELPTPFVLQSADFFAEAAVTLLHRMGVDTIVFGSESNNIEHIKSQFHYDPDVGQSYARQMGTSRNANDILGFQYIRVAEMLGIATRTIQRTNNYHGTDIDSEIASATAIRNHYGHKPVAHTTPLDLDHSTLHRLEAYDLQIRAIILQNDTSWLQSIHLVDEGIENLLKKNVHLPITELIEACISKRYTRSRIQRTLMMILLGIKRSDVILPSNTRILGMTKPGQAYLKAQRETTNAVTAYKYYDDNNFEMRATLAYSMPYPKDYRDWLIQMEKSGLIRTES